MRQGEVREQGAEPLTILGPVDGLRRRPHDRDAGFLQGARELEWGLATQLHQYALGLLHLHHVQDVLQGQRLEVETV